MTQLHWVNLLIWVMPFSLAVANLFIQTWCLDRVPEHDYRQARIHCRHGVIALVMVLLLVAAFIYRAPLMLIPTF